MKLIKSLASLRRKVKQGMSKEEGQASYEEIVSIYPNPNGNEGQEILIKTRANNTGEPYYCWKFYEEDDPKKKRPHFEYIEESQQERYEWFCAGWVQFYDEVIRDNEIKHNLFFYWDKTDPPGVAIYINDKNAIDTIKKIFKVSYELMTPVTATGDPPTVPPPPPPSST